MVKSIPPTLTILNTNRDNLVTPNGSYCRQLAPKAHVLYEPPDGSKPTMDLVFVHGLNSGEITCWQDDNDMLWPGCFIPKDFPTCRVLTLGYQSGMIKSEEGSDMNLLDPFVKATAAPLPQPPAAAEAKDIEAPPLSAFTVDDCARVLHDTLLSPAVDVGGIATDVHGKHRPVIFIVHSLGGLIAKQLLLDLELSESESETGLAMDRALLRSFKGIVCYSTPHFGSSVARYLNFADGPLLSAFQAATQAIFSGNKDPKPKKLPSPETVAQTGAVALAEASTNSSPPTTPSAKVATIIRSLSDSNLLHLHRLNRHFLRIITNLHVPVLCFGEGERVRGLLKVVKQESSDPLAPYRDELGKLVHHPQHPRSEVIDFSLFEHLILEDKNHTYVNMPDDMTHLGYTKLKEFLQFRVLNPTPTLLIAPPTSAAGGQLTTTSPKSAAIDAAILDIHALWNQILASLQAEEGNPHKQVLVPSTVYAALEIAEELLAMNNKRLGTLMIIRFWIRELMYAVRAILSPSVVEPLQSAVQSAFIPATKLSRSVSPFELRRMRVLRESLFHCLQVLKSAEDPPLNITQPMHNAFLFTCLVSLHQRMWEYRQAPHCISPLSGLEAFDWDQGITASQPLPVIPQDIGLDEGVAKVVSVALMTEYPSAVAPTQCRGGSLFAGPLISVSEDDASVATEKLIEQLLTSLDWDSPPPSPLAAAPPPGTIDRATSALTEVLRNWGLAASDSPTQSQAEGNSLVPAPDHPEESSPEEPTPKAFQRPVDKATQQWQLNAHQITSAMVHWMACSAYGELVADATLADEAHRPMGEAALQLMEMCVASIQHRRLEDEVQNGQDNLCAEPPACELVRAFLLQQTAAHEYLLSLSSRSQMDAMRKRTKTAFGAITERGRIHEGMAAQVLDRQEEAPVNTFLKKWPQLRTLWCDLHMFTFSMDVEVSLVQGTISRLAKQLGIIRGESPSLLAGPFSLALTYDKDQHAKPAVPTALQEPLSGADHITASAMRRKAAGEAGGDSGTSVWSWITSALSIGGASNPVSVPTQPKRSSAPKEEVSLMASEIGGALYEPSVMGTEAASSLHQIMLPNTSNISTMNLWERGHNTVRVQVPVHEEVYIRCKKVFGSASAVVADRMHDKEAEGRPVASLSLNRIVVDGGYIDPTDPSLSALQGRKAFISGDYSRAIRFFRLQMEATERSRHHRPDSFLTPALANDPRVSLAWSYLGRAARTRSSEGVRAVVEQMAAEGRATIARVAAKSVEDLKEANNGQAAPPPSLWSILPSLVMHASLPPPPEPFPVARLPHKPIKWGDAFATASRPERVLISALRALYSQCTTAEEIHLLHSQLDAITADTLRLSPPRSDPAVDVQIANDIFDTVLKEARHNVWSLCGKGRCLTMSLTELSSYNPSTDHVLHRQQQLAGNAKVLSEAIELFEKSLTISDGKCHYAAHFLGELGADVPKIKLVNHPLKGNGHHPDASPDIPPFVYHAQHEPAPFIWCPALSDQERQYYTMSMTGWSSISACVKVANRTMPAAKEEGLPRLTPPYYTALPSLSYASRLLEHFGFTSAAYSEAEMSSMQQMLKPFLVRALRREPRNVWGNSVMCLWAEGATEREVAKKQLLRALHHRLSRH